MDGTGGANMATDFGDVLITPHQFALLPNEQDYELVNGRLVERKMGNKSSFLASELARLLANYVLAKQLGWVLGSDAGYRLDPKRPNHVRKPDASFVRFGRFPNEMPADTYDELAPDLAIESVSPNDTVLELDEKIKEYLDAGVRLIWVINPDLRTVKIYRPGRPITEVCNGDELSGEDVVPGFACKVSNLFAALNPPPSEGN
jgi:Uma2 family endonuclease